MVHFSANKIKSCSESTSLPFLNSFYFHFSNRREAWQVTEKAWDAFAAEDWDAVETLANRAARTWGAKAKEINNTLIAFPSAEKAKKFANLNDLATITYLKGEALRKKGDTDGALAAYYTLLADYSFGQCWDKKGWWWQPATAAKDQLAILAPANQADIHLDTAPIKKSLRLAGKKGICFTLRQKDKVGSWAENIPKFGPLSHIGIIRGTRN